MEDRKQKKREVGNRLRGLRVLAHKTHNDMAKLLGITRQTWSAWERGENTPKSETLRWLASYFGTTVDFILEGKNPVATVPVRILGVVRAGEAILAEAEEHIDTIEVPQTMIEPGAVYFGLKVTGDSMQDLGIREGMTVLVRQQDTIDDGQIAIVLIEDSATLKKCYRANGSLILIPANPRYKEMKIPADKVKILGRVRYAISEF